MSSRAQRGDLGCEALTKKKREIASQARNDKQGCHRERSVAISPVVCWQTEKTRLFLRLTFLCLREERGDLAFQLLGNQKERLPRCARNDKKCSREAR